MTWQLALIIAALIVCPIIAGLLLRSARKTGELDELRDAMNDLDATVGKALKPPLERALHRLAKMLDRKNPE